MLVAGVDMRRRNRRNAAGSGLVEGVVGFVIILMVTFACLFLVTGAGLTAYYKYKLGCVVNRAAVTVAHHLYPLAADNSYFSAINVVNLTANTTQLVDQLLTSIGLPNTTQGATVAAKMVTGATSGRQFLVVTVTEPTLPIIQIPQQSTITVSVSDSAVCAVPLQKPQAILQVKAAGSNAVVIPGYLGPSPATPNVSYQLCP
jgi:hypothetical protein